MFKFSSLFKALKMLFCCIYDMNFPEKVVVVQFMTIFWHERLHCSWSLLGGRLATFSPSIATFSHRRSAQIIKPI